MSRLVGVAADFANTIEQQIDKSAEQIDLILAGKRYTRKPNDSRATVSQFVSWSEGGEFKSSTDFGINLRMPNLEKRWQLRFSSYDERIDSRRSEQRHVRDATTQTREKDFGAGLEFFNELGDVKVTFQPRFVLRSPVEMSYFLRFESSAERGALAIDPRLELFADANRGTGEFASLHLSYDLGQRWTVSLNNSEEYRDFKNEFTTDHGVSLSRALSDDKSIGFSTGFHSTNQPVFHLESFTVSTGYSHEIQAERISYGVTPFLGFTKARGWKGVSGISLSVDVIF